MNPNGTQTDRIPTGSGAQSKTRTKTDDPLTRAREENAHLKSLLRSIHRVSQLIAREKNLDRLLQGVCDSLVRTRGYQTAWLALVAEDPGAVKIAQSGFGGEFESIRRGLGQGVRPPCWNLALSRHASVLVRKPRSECPDCALSSQYAGAEALIRRLDFDGKILGLFTVRLPVGFSCNQQEMEFFEELARDVAGALARLLDKENLRRTEANLAEAQRIARLGNWNWDIVNNDITWSDEIYRIFGLYPGQFEATYQAFLDRVHPDDRETVREAVDRALDLREPYDLVHRIVRPDGDLRIVHERAEVTFDPGGRPVRMLGTVQDITELSRVHEERELLITAVESAGEAIVVTNADGVVLYVNPAFQSITGYSAGEVVGRDLHVLDSGEHDQEFFEKMREELAREGVWRGRLINRKKDGTPYQEECTVSAVHDDRGKLVNYVSVKRDVSEQLRLESISEAVNVADNIGYVFSGIRHEIGNPVNAVRMTLTALASRLGRAGERPAAETIGRCLDEISRIQYLLESLKSFNMFENATPKTIALADFLKKFHSLIAPDLEKRGIAFRVEVDPGRDACRADPRALQQVMLNIVTNSMEALKDRESPEITVAVGRESDRLCMEIRDNGCGMTTEQQEKLFRPFHTNRPGGSGLGLVIARRLLSKMDGSIEIESQPGSGTRVILQLPA